MHDVRGITSNARLNLGYRLVALGRLAEADEHYRAVEQVVRNPRPQDRWMLWRYGQHLCRGVLFKTKKQEI